MLILTLEDQKLISHLGTPRSAPRKNLWLMAAIVNSLHKQQHDTVTSKTGEQAINDLGLKHLWSLDPNAKDGYGLQKAIGDLLGGHGLKLKHSGRGKRGIIFKIPPNGIDDAYLQSIGIDPNELDRQALVPDLLTAINEKLIVLFHYHSDPEGANYRRFAPHIYYQHSTMPMIAGVQSGGYSESEARANKVGKTTPTWRIFHTHKMLGIILTVHPFHINPAYKPGSYLEDHIYAQV